MEKMLKDGRGLMAECREHTKGRKKEQETANSALYPVSIIFLGEMSTNNVLMVKDYLDENWKNAPVIQYTSIMKQGDSYCVRFYRDLEEQGTFEWVSDGSYNGWQEAISHVSVLLLQEDYFQDKTRIKMDFFLDTNEPDGEAYVDIFKNAVSGLSTTQGLKTLFLMADQRPDRGGAKMADALFQKIVAEQEEIRSTVYLLSNYLQSGNILKDEHIWKNYRLASDIILLGGNAGDSNRYSNNLYNGIKSASYALVTKATNSIAAVSLIHLISRLAEIEKSKELRPMTPEELREHLGIDIENEVTFMKEKFESKARNLFAFPNPETMQYFPYESLDNLKSDKPVMISPQGIKKGDYIFETSAQLFIKQRFIDPVIRYLETEAKQECVDYIDNNIRQCFGFYQLLELDWSTIEQMLDADYVMKGIDPSLPMGSRLYMYGVYEAKRIFYKNVKEWIKEALQERVQQAKNFRDIWQQLVTEVNRANIGGENESESIEKVYGREVNEYLETFTSAIGASGQRVVFPGIFNVDYTKEQLMRAILQMFDRMLEREVYQFDYEQEHEFRADAMGSIQKQTVDNELNEILQGRIRFNSIDYGAPRQAGTYYMINERAKYTKTLRERQKDMDFLIFNLNRTDCIEELQIYDITEPTRVKLV